ADLAGGLAVSAALGVFLPQPRVERRRVRQSRAVAVVADLPVGVASALEDGQPGPLLRAAHDLPDPHADPAPGHRPCLRSVHVYFPPALPTLRLMTSFAYLMPLAL